MGSRVPVGAIGQRLVGVEHRHSLELEGQAADQKLALRGHGARLPAAFFGTIAGGDGDDLGLGLLDHSGDGDDFGLRRDGDDFGLRLLNLVPVDPIANPTTRDLGFVGVVAMKPLQGARHGVQERLLSLVAGKSGQEAAGPQESGSGLGAREEAADGAENQLDQAGEKRPDLVLGVKDEPLGGLVNDERGLRIRIPLDGARGSRNRSARFARPGTVEAGGEGGAHLDRSCCVGGLNFRLV